MSDPTTAVTSKTAQKSAPKTGAHVSDATKVSMAISAEAARLVPLAGGRFVYFHDPITGRSPKLATSGPALAEALRPSCAKGLAPRIESELCGFATAFPTSGWDVTIQQLRDAEVI
jgi:hypothetical protein